VKDLHYVRKITKSEYQSFYITLPTWINVPSQFQVNINNKIYESRVDKRNRMYIIKFLSYETIKIDKTVEFVRKNDKYYFTVK